ncbi:hypothetical protein QJS10_CPA16g01022 [Acorus calamus]|uniref:Uncharacterized protein n=1 Tax=Acorus calamus TaxID=4465 RepID=A0AAV9D0Q8_ACOCL|nr:hypothetical protein QJS10_CPA16g01022 [Acorus calamus]
MGELHPLPSAPERLLYREVTFYDLLDHIRSAKLRSFDSNRLLHMASSRAAEVGYDASDGA